jgi:DNA-binding NarL/FixJ family response regulator
LVVPHRVRQKREPTLPLLAALALLFVSIAGGEGAEPSANDLVHTSALCAACAALAAGTRIYLERLAPRLSVREADVAGHVAFGWHNQDIADHLGISVRTVESHLRHIYAKLGIASRVQLALLLRSND